MGSSVLADISLWGAEKGPLGSGIFVLLLWSYFWARYFCSRLEASKEVGSKTLEETLDGDEHPTIASMQRLQKLRQTQKGRMRPAFKHLARRIAALDLRPGRTRHFSSANDLINLERSSSGSTIASPRTSLHRLNLSPASSRNERSDQMLTDRHYPTVTGCVAQTLASALPAAVRDAVLFRSLCDIAEQRQLAADDTLDVCIRGHRPAMAIVIVLDGTVEVSTGEVEMDGGVCRCTAGQSVTSLLTTLCALSGQRAPLPVRLRPIGNKPVNLVVLPTTAYVSLLQSHTPYMLLMVRKALGRLDAGLLEVAAHLGLGSSLLGASQAMRNDWQAKQLTDITMQMRVLARTTVSNSLGVPLSELPELVVLADGWNSRTAKNAASQDELLRLGRATAGFARLSPGSLLVVICGGLEMHPRALPSDADADAATDATALISPSSSATEARRESFIATEAEVVGLLGVLSAEPVDGSRLLRSHPAGGPCWVVEVPSKVVARCILRSPSKISRLLCAARHDTVVARLAPLGWRLDYALMYHSVRAHTVVLERGQLADGLRVVMSGRLRGVTDHTEYVRGSLIGTAELLDSGRVSSTVKAVRDSVLAQLPADLFQDVAATHPHVLAHVCRAMAQRAQAQFHEATSFAPEGLDGIRTIAIVPAGEGLSKDELDLFCSTLATAISTMRSCRVIDSAFLRIDLPLDFTSHHAEAALVSWLAEQEETARVILYQADLANTSWSRRCVRQADLVLRLANPTSVRASSPETAVEMALLAESISRQELVLLHIDPSKFYRPSHTRSWLSVRRNVKAHHHIRLHTSEGPDLSPVGKRTHIRGTVQWDRYDWRSDFHRLARHVCKCSVGLVLGGGGARGMAHLATIRALEEQGIPIDKIGGTSIGSFVGGVYAQMQDWKSTQYRSAAISSVLGSTAGYIKDLTCPLVSYFTGRGMNTGLQEIFGEDTRIEDLWLPFYCITANVASYREVVHSQGLLWRYVRASMSLQGYLPPLCETDERGNVSLLMDGGYLNNLPSDHMRSTGAALVIAVDVGGWTSVTW